VYADLHEFLLTSRGTALMTTARRVTVGGRLVIDGGVQELDLRTGHVLFDWHSIGNVALGESYAKPPRSKSFPFDFFHVNSIDVDRDGNFLVSARNTHTVYKISRRTGRILWRLGGKRSDFALGPGVRFAWQHDARRLRNGTIRIFDNGAAPRIHPQSRVIFLHLRLHPARARLLRIVVHRPPIVAINQGNAQSLPRRHLLVDWGHFPEVTEYDARGRVVLDLRFGDLRANSYRAFRFRWLGVPAGPPAIALYHGRVFATWNGATRIARWQLLAGRSPEQLHAVRSVRKTGFETSLAAPASPWVAARALDGRGNVLGSSRAVRRYAR
jgi:hypothetical protein